MPTIAILCPLEYELIAVRRALARAHAHAPASMPPESSIELIGSGPGGANTIFAVGKLAGRRIPPALIVLAGLAGGLRRTEACPRIAQVTDLTGARRAVRVPAPGGGAGVTVVGVEQPVRTIGEKRSLLERTGADLVDCESHAFAFECERTGLNWSVVRGVSDGPNHTLPAQVARWTDPWGKTLPGQVRADLLRNPLLLPGVIGLARRSSRAIESVGTTVVALLRERRPTMFPS
jgi:hypothetical protein